MGFCFVSYQICYKTNTKPVDIKPLCSCINLSTLFLKGFDYHLVSQALCYVPQYPVVSKCPKILFTCSYKELNSILNPLMCF